MPGNGALAIGYRRGARSLDWRRGRTGYARAVRSHARRNARVTHADRHAAPRAALAKAGREQTAQSCRWRQAGPSAPSNARCDFAGPQRLGHGPGVALVARARSHSGFGSKATRQTDPGRGGQSAELIQVGMPQAPQRASFQGRARQRIPATPRVRAARKATVRARQRQLSKLSRGEGQT